MTTTSAEEIYETSVRGLPAQEQLRLAALILTDLVQATRGNVDSGSEWSDEDMRDLTTFSLRHAATTYPEEEDGVQSW